MTRLAWTCGRRARLESLVKLGWDAQRIADDLGTSANNVYVRAHQFGFSLRQVARSKDAFYIAATKRGITRKRLVSKLLAEIREYPALIDNILDDLESERAA